MKQLDYGYTVPGQKPSGIALAARPGAADPFGLSGKLVKPQTPIAPQNLGAMLGSGYTPARPQAQQPKTPAINFNPGSGVQPLNTAPTPQQGVYDINIDPAYQQVVAYTGMSDSQAKAAATQQQNDLLAAWHQQQAEMQTAYDRNVHNLDESLNQANLSYGGYRIDQDKQAAQDYQNALAKAAGGVQATLHGIALSLAQALAQNQFARDQAAAAAASKAPAPPQPAPAPTQGRSKWQGL